MQEAPSIDRVSEMGLIGCALQGAGKVIAEAGILEDHFLDPDCRKAWAAIEKLNDANQAVSIVTVIQEGPGLKLGMLNECYESAPTESNYSYWIPSVMASAQRYQAWALCTRVARQVSSLEPEEILATLETGLSKLINSGSGVEDSTSKGWREVCDMLSSAGAEGVTGVLTGIDKVDNIYKGLRKGAMNTVAGRPGTGKSAFAGNVALNLAKRGKKVIVFTAEMAAREYQLRLLGTAARTDVQYYMREPTKGDAATLANKLPELTKLPITIVDSPSINTKQIRAYCRKAARNGLDLVIIDYLQLYKSGTKTHTRETEVSAVSRDIKQLAMESDVPVIVLCQMNRAVESRKDGAPTLSDLRESGAIEQDSDTVSFLVAGDNNDDNNIQMHLLKNRNGPQAMARLSFEQWSGVFN